MPTSGSRRFSSMGVRLVRLREVEDCPAGCRIPARREKLALPGQSSPRVILFFLTLGFGKTGCSHVGFRTIRNDEPARDIGIGRRQSV